MNAPVISSRNDIDPFFDLERILSTRLNPVQPDQEFVRRLERRLVTTPSTVVEPQGGTFSWLLLLFGLVSGALLVWGAVSLLRRWRH